MSFAEKKIFRLAVLAFALCFVSASAAETVRKVPGSTAEVQLSYAPVVSKAAPAVVNVYTKRVVETRRSPFMGDPFFERFFGRDWAGVPRRRIENSLGSGVILRKDGIVVTNNHVIEGGDTFTVVTNDRREFDAQVILQDEKSDLAVLRLDTKGVTLPALAFADSDRLEVGDLVLAIGNPFGVGQTVTNGIVSAVARTQVGVSDYQFFIQTDAAINPGNSGGALVDMNGKLVGVNTAIFSRSGGSNGIGFAIPGNMVKAVVSAALLDGTIVRPWLGVKGQTVTSDIAESLGLDRPIGVLISKLHKESAFAKAGIKTGDVVTTVGSFDIFDLQGLAYRVATRTVGEVVSVTYLRKGQKRIAKVKLARAPGSLTPEAVNLQGDHPLGGAEVAVLTPAFAEEHGFDWDQSGLVISRVEGRSVARRFGFRVGDIVLEVNGEKVQKIKQLETALAQPMNGWHFVISRGGQTMTLSYRF